MNKQIILLLAALALLTAATAPARAGQLASVSLVNQNTGEHLQIWRHGGRNYVAGNPGERYAIEITNKTGARVLSVVSVDGVNVINGATASVAQSGYVLESWRPLEIKGWRKSMDEVAAFYFTSLPDSYAARTGRADNVGVIGVALFQEYVEPAPVQEQYESRAMAPAASGMAAQKSKSADNAIGTGHGERLASASRATDFHRASEKPAEVISIYYDTQAHLVARGIIPRLRSRMPDPSPFPGNFVPDPS